MKVVQVSAGIVEIPALKGGAVEEHILKLSTELGKYCDVLIVDRFYEGGKNVLRFGEVEIRRIRARTVNIHPRVDHILNEMIFAKSLQDKDKLELFKDAEIIHAHNLYAGYSTLKIAKKIGAKFIYTCHNGMWCADDVNFYEKWIVRKLESKNMKESKVSIAVSENLRQNITRKGNVPENKIVTIYNGVDTNFFNPNINCEDIIEKYNLYDYFKIVFVGRIAPAKGIEYLIKALKELENYKIKALLVGPFKYMFQEGKRKSSYGESLLNLVKKYNLQDRVIFTDAIPRDELPKYYVAGDVFVLPSVYEAMAMVLVEAMACGVPVVVSNKASLPEIVGDAGYLVDLDENCVKEFAEKILKVLDRDRGIDEKALERSMMFSWEKTARETLKIYEEVLGC